VTAYRKLALLLPVLALALAGCGRSGHEARTETAAVPVRVVSPDVPARGTLTLPARVKAVEEATLTARSSGRVSGFGAREGQVVAAGGSLVRFEAPEARRALEASRAEEQAARVAASVAARQHARVESLFTAGVLAQLDREQAEAADRAAAARLATASAAREVAESAFEVRAPFAGVLVRRHVDVGADVQVGAPLVDLRSRAGAEVVTAVPEAASRRLAESRTWIQVGDGPWREARLLRADGMVDPATRTRTARYGPVEATRLEPGAFARVRIEPAAGAEAGARPGPVAVPLASIVRRGALTGVYVIEDDHAWLRWVRLGQAQGDRVEVLSGLVAADRVAASPAGLSDGARVSVTP
jgi:RND family efflux transporter MFP subunit